MIDFGLAIVWKGNPPTAYYDFAGTPMFASVESMSAGRACRKDDLEALAYVFVYMVKGALPWKVLPETHHVQVSAAIIAGKTATTAQELCEGLPDAFRMYMDRVWRLRIDERPDYAGYRELFRKAFIEHGYAYDCLFDWTVRLRRHFSFTFRPFHVPSPGSGAARAAVGASERPKTSPRGQSGALRSVGARSPNRRALGSEAK